MSRLRARATSRRAGSGTKGGSPFSARIALTPLAAVTSAFASGVQPVVTASASMPIAAKKSHGVLVTRAAIVIGATFLRLKHRTGPVSLVQAGSAAADVE